MAFSWSANKAETQKKKKKSDFNEFESPSLITFFL